jgi:hypothetical protein
MQQQINMDNFRKQQEEKQAAEMAAASLRYRAEQDKKDLVVPPVKYMHDQLVAKGIDPEIAKQEALQYFRNEQSSLARQIYRDSYNDHYRDQGRGYVTPNDYSGNPFAQESKYLGPINQLVEDYVKAHPAGRLLPPPEEPQASIEPSPGLSAYPSPSSGSSHASSSAAAAYNPIPSFSSSSSSSSSSSALPSSSSSSSSGSHSSLPSSAHQAPAFDFNPYAPPSQSAAHSLGPKYEDEERMIREQAPRHIPAPAAPEASAAVPPLEAPRAEPPRQNFFERFHQAPEPRPEPIPAPAPAPQQPLPGPYEGFNKNSMFPPEEGTPEYERHMNHIFGPAQHFASGGSVNAHGRFNMSPAEQAYIREMQEQQAPSGYAAGDAQSPIQRGSMAAAQSVRSMPLSDKQRQRSLGKGLGQFLMNFSKSKQDSGLGMMAESMVPGSIAYGEGLEAHEAHNEQLMREEMAREAKEKERADEAAYRRQKMGMEMLFHKERMGHQSAALNESRRYHDLLSEKTKEKGNDFPSREELESHGFEVPKDAISLHDVKSKPLQKTYIDKAAKAIKGIEPMKENLNNLSRMDELLEEYPNLSTSFARVAVNNNKENPSYLKSILQGMANKDEVDAVNEYAKLSSDLLSNQIESFEGSKMISNMHKQILMKSMSDPGTSKEAAKLVNAKLREKYARKLKYGQLSEDGLSKGLVYKTSAIDEEVPESSLRDTAMSFQEAHPELKGVPIEKIEARVKALGLAE